MSRSSSSSSRRSRRPDTKPADITTYSSAVRFLYERVDFERMRVVRLDDAPFKLDRVSKLMDALGNPQEQVRLVHVAGTVGKGSTVAMIASMLEGCGYAVGQFTSPHLTDVRERISINGHMIPRNEFTELMREAAEAGSAIGIDPTFFELCTAVAFRHFAEQAVDVAIVEVGLGGRFDATNIITPEVAVITQIDLDHTQILGRTKAEIAGEKAGIMKRGVPVITFRQEDEVHEVLAAKAEETGAVLRVVGGDIEFSHRFGASADLGPHTRVCVISETSQFMHLPVPLPGEHQAVNCALALAVIDTLKSGGFDCHDVPMLEGLNRTHTPGRMELLWKQPRILADGAHNPVAMGALMRSVGAHMPYDSMVCVFGCCEDKDIPTMLERAALGGDKIIFTRARTNPRAADPEELQRQFGEISGKMSQVARSLPEALDLATRAVGRDDLVCVTGSFYLVGEARKYLADLRKRRQQPAAGA